MASEDVPHLIFDEDDDIEQQRHYGDRPTDQPAIHPANRIEERLFRSSSYTDDFVVDDGDSDEINQKPKLKKEVHGYVATTSVLF